MAARYKIEADGSVTITMNIKAEGSMLEQEEQIAQAVAEMGRMATALSLQGFDTAGRSLVVDNDKQTSRGKEKKVTRRRTGK